MLRAHLCQDKARKKTQQGTLGSSSTFWCFNHLSMYKLGFPGGASGKEPACRCGRHKRREFDPWAGKIPWSRKWQPTQYSCLGNPMDRGDWSPRGRKCVGHDLATKERKQCERLRRRSQIPCSSYFGRWGHYSGGKSVRGGCQVGGN